MAETDDHGEAVQVADLLQRRIRAGEPPRPTLAPGTYEGPAQANAKRGRSCTNHGISDEREAQALAAWIGTGPQRGRVNGQLRATAPTASLPGPRTAAYRDRHHGQNLQR